MTEKVDDIQTEDNGLKETAMARGAREKIEVATQAQSLVASTCATIDVQELLGTLQTAAHKL